IMRSTVRYFGSTRSIAARVSGASRSERSVFLLVCASAFFWSFVVRMASLLVRTGQEVAPELGVGVALLLERVEVEDRLRLDPVDDGPPDPVLLEDLADEDPVERPGRGERSLVERLPA